MEREAAVKAILEKIKVENDGKHIDFVIPGYTAKKLIAYQSIREDLILCTETIPKLIESTDEVITLSLYHTLIILYGKCFSDAKFSKSPRLESSECFSAQETELLQTHNEIIHLRHNFTAHRGSTQNEIGFAYLKINIDDFSRQVRVKQIKRRMPKTEELPRYIKLFKHLISIVESKFEKEANKVCGHLLADYTPGELSMFKIAGPIMEQK